MNICRKTPHKTKAAAHQHIDSIVKRRRAQKRGSVYKCVDCGQFHITRSKVI